MCLDCGCMEPDNRHGDDRHIIMQDVVEAAKANDASVEEAWQTMEKTLRAVREGRLSSEAWTPNP